MWERAWVEVRVLQWALALQSARASLLVQESRSAQASPSVQALRSVCRLGLPWERRGLEERAYWWVRAWRLARASQRDCAPAWPWERVCRRALESASVQALRSACRPALESATGGLEERACRWVRASELQEER